MKKFSKRFLSVLLAAIMAVTVFVPMNVMAGETADSEDVAVEEDELIVDADATDVDGEEVDFIIGEEEIDPQLDQGDGDFFTMATGTPVDLSKFDLKSHTVVLNGKIVYRANAQREATINNMNTFALVLWHVPKGKKFMYRRSSTNSRYTTVAGYSKNGLYYGYFRGTPYTQFKRNNPYTTSTAVQTRIDKILGEIYGGLKAGQKPSSYVPKTNPVYGTDCSASVTYAWRYALNKKAGTSNYLKYKKNGYYTAYRSKYFTRDIFDKSSTTLAGNSGTYDYLNRIGYYGKTDPKGYYRDTKTVVNKLASSSNYVSGDIYSNVYAQMKPGDVLAEYYNSHGHVRLVNKVVIVTTDGKVNPEKSYAYITEQVGSFGIENKNGNDYQTSWRVDKKCTFKSLRNNSYVPMTVVGTEWDEYKTIKFDAKSKGYSSNPSTIKCLDFKCVKLPVLKSSDKLGKFIGWTTAKDSDVVEYRVDSSATNGGYLSARYNFRNTSNINSFTLYPVFEKSHKYTYSASGNVITEKCAHNCGVTHTAKLTAKSATYNGEPQKTHEIIKSSGFVGKGNVTYVNNVYPGKATAKYTIAKKTATTKFNIYPRKTVITKLEGDVNSFRVHWEIHPKEECSGYQVKYSKSSTMSSPKYFRQGGYYYYGLKFVKMGYEKTYYVQVRTYKKVDGVRYYSAWSTKKKVTTLAKDALIEEPVEGQ